MRQFPFSITDKDKWLDKFHNKRQDNFYDHWQDMWRLVDTFLTGNLETRPGSGDLLLDTFSTGKVENSYPTIFQLRSTFSTFFLLFFNFQKTISKTMSEART